MAVGKGEGLIIAEPWDTREDAHKGIPDAATLQGSVDCHLLLRQFKRLIGGIGAEPTVVQADDGVDGVRFLELCQQGLNLLGAGVVAVDEKVREAPQPLPV